MGYDLLSMLAIAISDASLVTSGEARLSLVAWRKRTATISTVSALTQVSICTTQLLSVHSCCCLVALGL